MGRSSNCPIPYYIKGEVKTITADEDYAQLLYIPPKTLVLGQYVVLIKAAGETCTASLGYYVSNSDKASDTFSGVSTLDCNGEERSRLGGCSTSKYFPDGGYLASTVTFDGGTGSVQLRAEALCVRF